MFSGGRYMACSPSPLTASPSAHIAAALVERDKYLSDLLAEREKLGPFMQVLPHSYRVLNQGAETCKCWEHQRAYCCCHGHQLSSYAYVEKVRACEKILRVTTLLGNASFLDHTGLEHASPLTSGGLFSNGADRNVWAPTLHSERLGGLMQSPNHGWLGAQGSSSGLVCKKSFRIDISPDKFSSYNFVGRLLGPRGNSLKRVEATTECRVLIRGRGSINDPAREELRGKPGYEHLNEPLHVVVEAELPVEIIDFRLMQAREIIEDLLNPVIESQDYKKQQLRELAILNGSLRDDRSQMSGSASPFHNSLGMKRAKTRV